MGTFRPWSVEKGTDWDDFIAKSVIVVSWKTISGRLRLYDISRRIFTTSRRIEKSYSPKICTIDQPAGRRREPGASSPGQADPYCRVEPGCQTGPGFFFSPQPVEELHTLSDIPLEESLATAKLLFDAGFLHQADTIELTAPIHQPDQLIAWLHLTDRCNLRCQYCYLPHAPIDMTIATSKTIVEMLFRTAAHYHFAQVQLKYSGGEPLLRFPTLLEIQKFAARVAQETQIELDAVILSNGTLLTEAMIEATLGHGMRLMISMDCLNNDLTDQRPYANGRSSADEVKHVIELAIKSGLRPHISVTVSGRSTPALPAFVEWLLANNLTFNLNFYRENNLSASDVDLRLQENEVIEALMASFSFIRANLPRQQLFSSLVDRSDLASPHSYPCGVGQNYLVFNPQGEISKCQMTQNDRITDLNAADPLSLVRSDTKGLQNPPVDEKTGCQNCEWRYACAGGCPLLTHRKTGSYQIPSPNCNIYRAIYPEALRLEGLRLLKYGSDLPTS